MTTFSALSTSLALSIPNSTNNQATARVYLAILIGSSLGTAKSRVIYGVDSFATRVWGKDDSISEGEEEGHWSGEEFPEESEGGDSDGSSISDTSHDVIATGDADSVEYDGNQNAEESEEDEEEETYEGTESGGESPPSPSQCQSYAEEQRFLQAADRLLSRALASADVEGHTISNEMRTFTHCFFRHHFPYLYSLSL